MVSINMGKSKSTLFMVFFLILGYEVIMINSATSPDVDKERQECATQLVGLLTCLPYVGPDGTAKAPSLDCCNSLKQALKNSKKCVCFLVKNRDDPALGLKVNATRALGLPDICNTQAYDIYECPKLLNLAPNSPEAKVFQQFGKENPTIAGNPKTGPSGGATAQGKNEAGGKRSVMFRVEMVGGVFLWCFASLFINGVFV